MPGLASKLTGSMYQRLVFVAAVVRRRTPRSSGHSRCVRIGGHEVEVQSRALALGRSEYSVAKVSRVQGVQGADTDVARFAHDGKRQDMLRHLFQHAAELSPALPAHVIPLGGINAAVESTTWN